MKINNIIIVNDFDYVQGGASKVAIDTANFLQQKKYNVIFVCPSTDSLKSSLNKDISVVTSNQLEFIRYNNKISGMFSGLKNRKFKKLLTNVLSMYSCNDSIVHIHGWTKSCSSVVFDVCRKFNFKVFLTLHDYFTMCPNGGLFNYRKLESCKLKPMKIKCCLSNCDSRNYLFKLYRYVREKKYIKAIKKCNINYIFISHFQKKKILSYLQIEGPVIYNPISIPLSQKVEKKFDFVFIGRTSKEKGIDLFVELANRLSEQSFIIVGNFEKKVPNNVKVTGWVTEEKVNNYLSHAKVLVFPSLWPETFGLNVYKAKFYKTLCLVSSNTAAIDFITDNDVIFEQGNINDLVEKAKFIINKEFNDENSDFYSENDRYINSLINYYNNTNI